MRTNRQTIDDSARQTLSMAEIEELKREGTGAGKDLIAKLMASHLGIEQKTAFSLAKYKLLKTKKYLRRFTILPLDVGNLCMWMNEEKDAGKILEVREEMLGLVGSWGNAHFAETLPSCPGMEGGRWLVVDETGGLIVAALAERMGILYPPSEEDTTPASLFTSKLDGDGEEGEEGDGEREKRHHHSTPPLATSNTITLIHTNAQPNLTLLKYFSYDPTNKPFLSSQSTTPHHPLTTHLQPLSWLQLLSPSRDITYSTPIPPLSPGTLSTLKSGKRGTYYRKLRRYNRVHSIVDTTLSGGFNGLVIASTMDPISILRHTIPLLSGGAPIAIYSPTIEPLVILSDIYSTSRRTAFIQSPPSSFTSLETKEEREKWQGDDDFPLNPTLLLNTSVQSARVREWQVLPGRTHPFMTGKGGAEGYLFTAVRVIPAEGRVEARGKFARRKAAEVSGAKVELDAEAEVESPPKKRRSEMDEKADLRGVGVGVGDEGASVEEEL
jgi:tRNA (adenine-N(1)-)-methyltransferase non-catalytic subunit